MSTPPPRDPRNRSVFTRLFGAGVLLGLSLAGSNAVAGNPHTIEDLASRVPLIVVGRCDGLQSAWNSDMTLITTTATYRIERVVKGNHSGRDLDVRQLGGSIGRITQSVLGGPQFRVGERSLLFLAPDGAGQMRVYGLGRGKQDLHRDPRSGVDRVRLDDGAETRLIGRPAGSDSRGSVGSSVSSAHTLSGDIPLDTLIKTMRGAR